MGTAAGVTNFCGLHANVHGEIRQVVHGIADELLSRIDRLGGLNAPHIVFGKIEAQAYDTAAYKCAADDLLLGHGVEILFHALGAGVVMDSADTIRALIVETKSGRAAVTGRIFIDCSGDGDLAAWAGAPFEHGDGARRHALSDHDVPRERRRSGRRGRGLEDDPRADGGGRAARREISAQGRDRPAAEKSDRMARQRHADEARRTAARSTAPTPMN